MKEINYCKSSIHEVTIGVQERGVFLQGPSIGRARRKEQNGFFELELYSLPNVKYFISKNDYSDEDYAIFSKRTPTSDGYNFSQRIGSAGIFKETTRGQKYLRIQIPVFKGEFYMKIKNNKEQEQEWESICA